jgi:hypothetical protein
MTNFLEQKLILVILKFRSKTHSIQDANQSIFLIKIQIPIVNLLNTIKAAQQKTTFLI